MKMLLLFLTYAKLIFSYEELLNLTEKGNRMLQNSSVNADCRILLILAVCVNQEDCFKCNSYKDSNIKCIWRNDRCVVNNRDSS
jgi:hypothetical protein